jgi:hypothetical protein
VIGFFVEIVEFGWEQRVRGNTPSAIQHLFGGIRVSTSIDVRSDV